MRRPAWTYGWDGQAVFVVALFVVTLFAGLRFATFPGHLRYRFVRDCATMRPIEDCRVDARELYP